MTWLLLIYNVPAQPSRKRATIWRAVKRAGAVYLRDGVCAVADTAEATATLTRIAEKVEEFGGRATVARSVLLDEAKSDSIMAAARVAREAEYADLRTELAGFLSHVQRESEHRDFRFSELEDLEADLEKLRRWSRQIAARDFTGRGSVNEVQELLARCETELGSFMEEAYRREEAAI